MPRKPRFYLDGVPAHVIQRGNNRSACFFSDDDYVVYKAFLREACRRYSVALHAYVLMTNHVHLLLTPERKDGISRTMQSVGRCYVQYVNKANHRTGTLWEGRHKASLIDAESYLLSCHRYIELNPVRAGMVQDPGDFRWSSYRFYAYGEKDELVREHALYRALGAEPTERQASYRALFTTESAHDPIQAIRTAAAFSMPLGNDKFRAQIEALLGRPIGHAGRGRPVKKRIG